MKFIAGACALLAFHVFSVAALSGHGFVLEERQPGAWRLLVQPRLCTELNSVNIEGLPLQKASGFNESVRQYGEARRLVASAKSAWPWQMLNLGIGSYYCFSKAADATNSLIGAVKAALSEVDKEKNELEFLHGGMDDLAGGVSGEILAAEEAIEKGDGEGDGLGERMARAARKTRETWEGFPLKSDFSWLPLLASQDSILSDLFVLKSRIRNAVSDLWEQNDAAAEALNELEGSAEDVLEEMESEGVSVVREEEARQFVEETPEFSEKKSFRQAKAELKDALRDAKQKAAEASRLLKEKKIGYLGKALDKRREAIAGLEDASAHGRDAIASARRMEAELKRLVAEGEAEAEKTVSERSGEPLAYAHLKQLLVEYRRLSLEYYSQEGIGRKINHLLGQLRELQAISEEARQDDARSTGLERLAGRAEEVGRKLGLARKDGIEVDEEEAQLALLRKKIAALREAGPSPEALEQLRGELDFIESKVNGKAGEKFREATESGYEEAKSLEGLLDEREREKLEDYSGHFAGGRLDVGGAIGELSEMAGFFGRKADEVAARAQKLVTEELERNLAIRKTFRPARIGESVNATAEVQTLNSLPIEAEGVQLALAGIPPDAVLEKADDGIELRLVEGKPVLHFRKAPAGSEFGAMLSFETVPAKNLREERMTLQADGGKARKVLKASFEAVEEGTIVLEFRVPEGSSHNVVAGARFEDSSAQTGGVTNVVVAIEAEVGRNSLEIYYEFDAIEASWKEMGTENGRVWLELEMTNTAEEELGGVEIEEAYSGCSVESHDVTAAEGITVEGMQAGGILLLSLKAREWMPSETKKAFVEIACSEEGKAVEMPTAEPASVEQVKPQQASEENEGLRKQAEGALARAERACDGRACSGNAKEALERAYKAIAAGDYGKVLDLAGEVELEERRQEEKRMAEFAGKKAALEEYAGKLREEAVKAIGEFEAAFSVEEGFAQELKKSALYKSGSSKRDTMAKAIAYLDNAFDSSQQEDGEGRLANVPLSKLERQVDSLRRQTSELTEVNDGIRSLAEKQVRLAAEQAGENAKTGEARQLEEDGRHFSAYLAASEALKAEHAKAAEPDSIPVAFAGVAGLALLVVLAYVYLFRNKVEEQRIVR